MILTCPKCATGYFVDDAQIKPGGRSVKCAACGHRWTADATPPLDLVTTPEEGAIAREADAAEGSAAMDLSRAFRARQSTKRQVRELAVTGMIWGGMAFVLAAVVAVALVFRVDIVRLWPHTASAYAGIGLPVNRVGLVIEGVRAEPALQDGHAALAISGMIRNVEDRTIVSPPIRISLYNGAGKRVYGKILNPSSPSIPPGKTRYFSTAVLDPPSTSHDLEVAFALEAHGRSAPAPERVAAPPPAQKPGLRGPTSPDPVEPPLPTVEATPLPADAPNALPPAATHP